MKLLSDYIIEKFKINSKTVKNKEDFLVNKIFKLWGFTDITEDIEKIVSKWITDNNINDIYPVVSDSSIEYLQEILDDDIIEKYDTDINLVEKCNKIFKNSDKVYHYNERGERFNIYISKDQDMISLCYPVANLYCLKN